jgi:ribonuclease Z
LLREPGPRVLCPLRVNTSDKAWCSIDAGRLTIEGRSQAGNETWFRVPELGVSLDIGRCPDVLVGVPHIFITHAHLDHALGVPFYAGQRRLQRLSPGDVYVPAEALSDFQELMRVHERLECVDYDTNLHGLAPGSVVNVRRDLEVVTHRATHRVAANAYEFVEIRHKLRAELSGLSGQELSELRHSGVDPSEAVRRSLLLYTGDTDRGIFEVSPALFETDVLVIECSFISDGHRARAAEYRHIHFDDLADYAERFENEWIVLTHFSRRYSPEEVQRGIRKRCPEVLRQRIRLALPEPFQRL